MHTGGRRVTSGDDENGSSSEESVVAPRRSTRQRFFNCRVCLGRVVAGTDRLNCAHPDCRACVHQRCAQTGSWVRRAADQGGGWLCPVCGLEDDDEGDAGRSDVEEGEQRPARVALQQPFQPQPRLPLPQQQQQQQPLPLSLPVLHPHSQLHSETLKVVLNKAMNFNVNFSNSGGGIEMTIQNSDLSAPMATTTAVCGARSGTLPAQTNPSVAVNMGKADQSAPSASSRASHEHMQTSRAGGSSSASTSQAANNGPTPAKRMRPACPICCQPVELSGATRPETCEHVFCFSCLMRWRRGSNSCPLDRLPFDGVLVTMWPDKPPVRIPVPPVSERHLEQEREQQYADDMRLFDVCAVCRIPNRQGHEYDDVLICDHCEVTFHVACLGPERLHWLDNLDDGAAWLCPDCAEHVNE